MATCSELINARIPDNAGEDSISFLPALLGKFDIPNRPTIVNHSSAGRFAIREGTWKLSLCPGSGGWALPKDEEAIQQGLPSLQLHDLAQDPAEATNLQATRPDIVNRLKARLRTEIANGRSTPGTTQANDVPVKIEALASE